MGTFGWVLLMVIAVGLALVGWHSLNPPPQLEITYRGILDRRLALGWLDWSSIEGAYRPRSPDGNRVLLRVRVDERLGRRLGRRMTRGQPIPRELELVLDLSGTRYSEVEVLQEIMAHSAHSAHGQGPGPEMNAALTANQTRVPCR